ncbi:MAG: hypothetical protein PHH98_05385 [Candidatus Gracilibacteria bacterium]|nr:hypothetical protein [Candidatus Gracilibacteria bacterium]
MLETDVKTPTPNEEKSTNIFDEFSTDSSLVDEVEKLKEETNKDTFYYISLTGKILQKIFIILFLLFILLFGYIYIQKSDSFSDNSLLDPICSIFIDSSILKPEGTTYCSSVSFTKTYYEGVLEKVKTEQTSKILENIIKIYEENNFTKTRDIVFLLDKSKDRLSVLKVLEKFDTLKNDYSGNIDKSEIQCERISIDTDKKELVMTCYSFAQGYESSIIGFQGTKDEEDITGGTSISIANSFLNYIEKNSKEFTLIDRQKVFSSESMTGESNGYTNKTSFDVKLKINF